MKKTITTYDYKINSDDYYLYEYNEQISDELKNLKNINRI